MVNLKRKRFLIPAAVVILLAVLSLWYLSGYYPADACAAAMVNQTDIYSEGNVMCLPSQSDTAIVFYPGAKVDTPAYLPLLEQLRDQGFTCFLVDMPFHMAFFDLDAAVDIVAQHPEISHWYLCGHSLGGSMASSCAAKHPELFDGLLLLAAGIYGDYPVEKTLTVYGSLNTSVLKYIDYTENIVVIDGGNHAQFGNYGPQKGDCEASISAEDQQEQTVRAIVNFIQSKTGTT